VHADYDAYWAELGGVADGSAWRLPAHLGRKAVEDIASKKRSQYRRRHALEDLLVEPVQAMVRPGFDKLEPERRSASPDVFTCSSADCCG
jgi:uncharacterized protein VirK/YbjX